MVADARCGLRREQVAAGGLEEFQHRLVFKRGRIGEVDHHLRAGQGRFESLAGDGVDAGVGRGGDDLVAALAQNGGGLRADQAGAADDDDLHDFTSHDGFETTATPKPLATGSARQRGELLESWLPFHRFDPTRSPGACFKRIAEILRFPRNLAIRELHDTDRVGRLPVVQDDVFADPQTTGPDYAPDFEALSIWLQGPGGLDIASPTDPLARLRIFQHRVVSVDLVLQFEIVGIGRGPVLVQRRADSVISYGHGLLSLVDA